MNFELKRADTTLGDKYTTTTGWVYLTGMQALVRLPLQQRLRDEAAGLNTGGYISGYRGSPMGRYDMELWAIEKTLKDAKIVFRAGLNEDLAATAIWGAQYVGTFPGAKVDGVFGIWYGKGPGVDRSGDVLRHANLAGTSPLGGVLCLAGDDHGAKSSTVANFSDPIFMAVGMPVLYPSNTQELLDYGLHGIAMSRYSGCWVGMKVVTDVVEGGGSVYVSPDAPIIQLPPPPSAPKDAFGAGYHIRGFDMALPQEDRLYNHKHAAVLAYARANNLNRIVVNPQGARVGIISAGKAWQDLLQALGNLELNEAQADKVGLRLLKVGMVWPLDPEIVRQFAEGLDTVIVVEEKRPILEDQLRAILYGSAAAPRIVGKHISGGIFDLDHGAVAFPNSGELSPNIVTKVIADVMGNALPTGCSQAAGASASKTPAAGSPTRAPSFCSGCPHNRSTKLPEGSRALAGIGCHTMAVLVNPKITTTVSHMGAEGVMWLGQQPFTAEKHVFANIGDGTYAHSGFLAIRQAIAAKVPITYKLLYNGFVSMTGGQPVESGQSPSQILASLAGEGVRKMAVVTDELERYDGVVLPAGVTLHHRTEMEDVQRDFREYPDVSVILYDQPCATERRRLRKRGKWADPDKRSFINPAVCEGCGDCGTASNCMSIEPLETELGRKRKINQASCNKDYSCVEGFCPSFVTVQGGKLRKTTAASDKAVAPAWTIRLTEPVIPALNRSYSVLIGGIGGTGVVTIGQTLAMAAHVQGYFSSNLDITGLAQKYGAVSSHVHIASTPEMLNATRIAAGGADSMVGCDLIVAASEEAISRLTPGKSHAVICTDLVPTADFARNPDWQVDAPALVDRLRSILGSNGLLFEGQRLAVDLMSDPIAANMLSLGAAWQLGHIPLTLEAIHKAIELNGVAIDMNKEAFTWGRRAAHDLPAVERFIKAKNPAQVINIVPRLKRSVDDIVNHRSKHLVEHTGEALAQRYRAYVDRVRKAEAALGQGDALTQAVAHNYHKLLAVKDEWEVSRLYSHPDFKAALEREFEGDYTLNFHVGAWPFAKVNGKTGKITKGEAGPWLMTAFKLMSRFKSLRGSLVDPFRNNAERVLERKLLAQYESDFEGVLSQLDLHTLPLAIKLASLPQSIRGYGHVKEAQAALASSARDKLLRELTMASHPSAKAA
jgi:indolepyruvate ferredoxin oxidoreductase